MSIEPRPAPYYGPATPLVRPTSGLAVTSLVLSIVWLFGLGSIIAIVTGVAAMKQTKTGQLGGHGLAVAGLIIGILGALPVVLVLGSWFIGFVLVGLGLASS